MTEHDSRTANAPHNGGGDGPEAGTPPETAAPAEGAAPAPSEPSPEERIAELNDRLLRALAETENLRRRAKKEREDALKYGVANFARDMLPIADNLHRALAAMPEGVRGANPGLDTLIEGIELTERALLSTLERHGIRRIDPMGEKFSHELHEAMFELATDDHPPGTVVQVLELGYMISDRLLRAARVGVAKPAGEGGEPRRVDTTA